MVHIAATRLWHFILEIWRRKAFWDYVFAFSLKFCCWRQKNCTLSWYRSLPVWLPIAELLNCISATTPINHHPSPRKRILVCGVCCSDVWESKEKDTEKHASQIGDFKDFLSSYNLLWNSKRLFFWIIFKLPPYLLDIPIKMIKFKRKSYRILTGFTSLIV